MCQLRLATFQVLMAHMGPVVTAPDSEALGVAESLY